MPEGQILEQESGMGLEASDQATEKQQKELEHDRPTSADEIQKSTFSTAYGVFATHNGETQRRWLMAVWNMKFPSWCRLSSSLRSATPISTTRRCSAPRTSKTCRRT